MKSRVPSIASPTEGAGEQNTPQEQLIRSIFSIDFVKSRVTDRFGEMMKSE